MTQVPADCVYCLGNGILSDEQVLVRGDAAMLCAPRGQIVEGWLAIAPVDHVGSISQLRPAALAEAAALQQVMLDFYRMAYGATDVTFYEQGRAGGGDVSDPELGFPHHAHLCGVPVALDVGRSLDGRFAATEVDGPGDVALTAGGEPYLYLERRGPAASTRRVYQPRSEAERDVLRSMRLKPLLAELLGCPERGDWRRYPGDEELRRVIADFARFDDETTGVHHGSV